jgi:hypothetical protein
MKANALGFAFLFWSAVACAAPQPFTAGPEAFDPHGAHIQGIAASEDALYVAQMTRLVKLDWKGQALASRNRCKMGGCAFRRGGLLESIRVERIRVG